MPTITEVQYVLSSYPQARASEIEPLGSAGGFSGASFWRVSSGGDAFCLRRWPAEHPDRARLSFIHAVLLHVASEGVSIVPRPMVAIDGTTFVSFQGHFWELTPWLPGIASFRDSPTDEKLTSTMQCLATFHMRAASLESGQAIAPGILERLRRLDELEHRQLPAIEAACQQPPWSELTTRAGCLLDAFRQHASRIRDCLVQASRSPVMVQPCIRDIWHDHVLFTGDEVSGIVDFGAMRIDHVAADVARLLGSLVADNQRARLLALDAYQQTRCLDDDERFLVAAYDRSSTLLSGLNWLQWICVDQRRFSNRSQVIARIDGIIERVERL